MTTHQTILHHQPSDEAAQQLLHQTRQYLLPKYKLAGTQEARRVKEIEESQLVAIVRNPIATYIQTKLYELLKLFPVGVLALRSKDEQASTVKRGEEIAAELNAIERETAPLTARNKQIRPDRIKQRLRRIVPIVAVLIALGDGLLAATGFLSVFGFVFSIVLAGAISAIIALLPKPAKTFVMRTPKLRGQVLRFLLIALIAMVVFYAFAALRAAAYNSQTSTSLTHSSHIIVSPLIICTISCFLFLGLVTLFIYLHSTPERKALDDEYIENTKELGCLAKRHVALKEEQTALSKEAIKIRDLSRGMHHDKEASMRQLIAIGAEAYTTFAESYTIQRGTTPVFFNNAFSPTYTLNDPFTSN